MIGYDKERKTYYVQVKQRDPLTNNVKWHKKRGFKLKRDAQEYEARLLLSVEQSHVATFRECWYLWEANTQCSEPTRDSHRAVLEGNFVRFLDEPINSISTADLLKWHAQIGNSSYSTGTKNKTLGIVKAIFKFASEVYGISNPSAVLKRFKATKEDNEERMHVWSAEQFSLFIQHVDKPIYQIVFRTLFMTGMRKGELAALQVEDLEDHKLTIHGTYSSREYGVRPTKTGAIRTISLDDKTYNDLFKLKADFKHGFLFGGDAPMSVRMMNKVFNRAIENAGLPHITIHDLRHSHATILINNGVNIVAVSKRLGHANVNMTLKVYTHLLDKTEDEMMKVIDEIGI